MVREHTLYDIRSYKCVEIYFTTQFLVYLGICSMGAGKGMHILQFWGVCAINVDEILLVDNV